MKVQMDFPLVSDAAAKQSIDASRAYRELVRVQRQLQALGGTMFWKPVGDYTYLAQRTSGKLAHLGARTPETEARFETFRAERSRLQARAKTLASRIQLHERMNHAVHAGASPAAVVQALVLLEDIGVAQDCLWISREALLAYAQSSGLAIPLPFDSKEPQPPYVLLLPERPDARARMALNNAKAFECAELSTKNFTVLLLRQPGDERTPGKFSWEKDDFNGLKEEVFNQSMDEGLWGIAAGIPFEQVVISKKGRMGLMRTLDPKMFLVWTQSPLAKALGLTKAQAQLVQQLLDTHRILSNMEELDPGG